MGIIPNEHLASGRDEPWSTWRSFNRLRLEKGWKCGSSLIQMSVTGYPNPRPANLKSLVSVTKKKFVRNKCWSVSNVFGPPTYKLFAHINFKKSLKKLTFDSAVSHLFPNVFVAITVRHVTSSRHNACTHSLNFGIPANERSFFHITHKIHEYPALESVRHLLGKSRHPPVAPSAV